ATAAGGRAGPWGGGGGGPAVTSNGARLIAVRVSRLGWQPIHEYGAAHESDASRGAGRADGPAGPEPVLVTAEGFLQPPGAAGRGDLRVDDQRPVARPGQPLADRAEVAGAAYGHPGAAEPAPAGGDASGRGADR